METIEVAQELITVRATAGDYRCGDLLNALDELCCYYTHGPGGIEESHVADVLEMYAKHVRQGEL